MTFKTRCPHCNCKLEMDDQWLGEECQCPRCQNTFVISSRPEPPKLRPVPKIVPVPTPAPAVAKIPSVTAPSMAAPAPARVVPTPAPPLPTPSKISFRPAPAADRTPPPQQDQRQGKRLICPKCKKCYFVNQVGVYPCACGTSLELLENGSVNVRMILPKHGVGFHILIGVLSSLMLLTVIIVMVLIARAGR